MNTLKSTNFQDPRSQRLMQHLGLPPATASPTRDKLITRARQSLDTQDSGDYATYHEPADFTATLDLRKMEQMISQQFSELRPAAGALANGGRAVFSQAGGNRRYDPAPAEPSAAIPGTDYLMRPVTSPCFDLKEKRTL